MQCAFPNVTFIPSHRLRGCLATDFVTHFDGDIKLRGGVEAVRFFRALIGPDRA